MAHAHLTLICIFFWCISSGPAGALSQQDCKAIEAQYNFTPAECLRQQNNRVVYSGSQTEGLSQKQLENHIFFPSGGTKFTADATAQIDLISAFVARGLLGDICLKLIGHSDSSGSAAANERVALSRAIAVQTRLRDWLASERHRIEIESAGENDHLTNLSAASRWQRRVEIRAKTCGERAH